MENVTATEQSHHSTAMTLLILHLVGQLLPTTKTFYQKKGASIMENVENYTKEDEMIQQAENDSVDFSLELSESCKVVGIGEQFIGDFDRVLKEYKAKYEVHKENEELGIYLADLLDARDVIGRTNLLTQLYDKGSFIIPANPFENCCPKCHGTGELYLFNRVPKDVECNRCEDGVVWVRCRSCKGSQRYQSRFKDGGGIDVLCKTCQHSPEDHKGEVPVKCRVCGGSKVARIMVLDHSLKSTTPCPVCDRLGFLIPKEETPVHTKTPDNPVLAGDLAEKLKEQIDDSDDQNFDAETETEPM